LIGQIRSVDDLAPDEWRRPEDAEVVDARYREADVSFLNK
jgi:hypothetical protein